MRNRGNRGTCRATALLAAALAAGTLPHGLLAQAPAVPGPGAGGIVPTGQRITPAGTQTRVNSMPIAAELSPDGRYLAVLQAGFETPSLTVLELSSGAVASRIELPDAWLGLVFNGAGDRVFVSGGARSSVWNLSFRDGRLAIESEWPLPKDCPGRCDSLIGDLRLDSDDRILYALDVFRNQAVIVNTQSGLVLGEMATGAAPYRARLAPDGAHLLISHWGEASVGLYRIADRRLVERIPVGEHPTDLVLVDGPVQAPGDGFDDETELSYPARLFVACSHADNLWTFGIDRQAQFELLDARSVAPLPGSPLGSLPSALDTSVDGKTLYVANAGNNVILVVDIGEALPEPAGAIPTGWFPTAVVALADGGVAYLSGKGDLQGPGLVSRLPALTSDQLESLSLAAVANLDDPVTGADPEAPGGSSVALVLTDARGDAWRDIVEGSALLSGYAPPSETPLGRLAWLTSAMETDFFAKLGPAVAAGRLTQRALAAAGRAARPAAGTLWSNARDASITAETYGIGGGRPLDALLAKLEAEVRPARLTVVRLIGAHPEQDRALGRLWRAWSQHPAYGQSVLFVVPIGDSNEVAVTGGRIRGKRVHGELVSAASLLRTIGWLLGLRPMTQFDSAAPILGTLFEANP